MGNAQPSSRHVAPSFSSSSTAEISSADKSPTTTTTTTTSATKTAIGGDDQSTAPSDTSGGEGKQPMGIGAATTSMPSSSSSSSSSSSRFDPTGGGGGVSIQVLGSGGGSSGPNDDAGHYYNVEAVAGGGYGVYGYGYGAPPSGGDALLSSLVRDMTPSALGGDDGCRLLSVGRLWPGSGRMMRSYRMRVRVPRIESASDASGGSTTTTTTSSSPSLPFSSPETAATSSASSSYHTIEVACKAFVVRCDKGEAHLRRILAEGDAELRRLRSLLSDPIVHPHALVYGRWIVGLGNNANNPSMGGVNNPIPSTTSPSSRNVYLLRQHAHASLSDRLVSRPFLTSIEKNWIAYQLLRAMQSLHDAGVSHGHLTTENVLLTSWNWVLVADVGCQHYKPVVLPDDDPGPWIHWFEGRGGGGGGVGGGGSENFGEDGSSIAGGEGGGHRGGGNNGEKKCCLAPERFYGPAGECAADGDAPSSSSSSSLPTGLTPEMDVFSLGCVLIELFLNGERAMDLGDLMEYRRVRATTATAALPQSLKQKLDKIESSKMRAAVRHMLSLNPSSRLSPEEYLERLSSSTATNANAVVSTGSTMRTIDDDSKNERMTHAPVPSCFGSALYPFMLRLRTHILSPDARIALVAMRYGEILMATVGENDDWGSAYFSRVIGPTLRRYVTSPAVIHRSERRSSGETKRRDLSSLSMDELLLETENLLSQLDSGVFNTEDSPEKTNNISPVAMTDRIPKSSYGADWQSKPSPSQESIIILLQVVFSSVGHVQHASSKFVALKLSKCCSIKMIHSIRHSLIMPSYIHLFNLVHRVAIFSSDEIRLQRIVPVVTLLLNDPEPIVRASGISVLASVLSGERIFLKLKSNTQDYSLLARIANDDFVHSAVTTFPPSDASIFPRYVFKKVAHLITDSSLIVRVAFAQNIALLAETAKRFLDVGHAVKLFEAVAGRHSRDVSSLNDTSTRSPIYPEAAANLLGKQSTASGNRTVSNSNLHSPGATMVTSSYDSDLALLHEVVFRWVVHIATETSDHSSQSKQALLHNLPRLCNFFGVEYSFQILPIILAFLNDRKDWQLRAALCKHLPS
jgi:phosphoinositide-3-kinase regulatory subunit 4